MRILDTLKRAVTKEPDQTWVSQMNSWIEFTPDIGYLQQYERIRLFVYGEEMSHHWLKEEMLGDLQPMTPAFTFENFAMWKHNLGKRTYPVVMDKRVDCEQRHWFKSITDLPWCKIKGELYAVDPKLFLELDKHKRNGVQFIRKRTQLIIPYREKNDPGTLKLKDIKAWMYIGKPEYWDDIISTGAQVKQFTPVHHFERTWGQGSIEDTKQFYAFTSRDYVQKPYKMVNKTIIRDLTYQKTQALENQRDK